MLRHLILGGVGYIGKHVAAELSAAGEPVTISGRRASPPPGLVESVSIGSPVEYREVDLVAADWDRVLQDFDVVHHYAWSTFPATANENPMGDFDVHVRGSLNLLEAARRATGKRIVFLSSGGTVYGRHDQPAREDDPLRPIGAYGAGKATVETYLRVYHTAGWLDARVARLSNPYGAGQDPARRQGAVNVFIHRALEFEPLEIWGDGQVVRDYIYIGDAARGLAQFACAALPVHDMPIVNFGSGHGASLNQIVELIEAHLSRPVAVERRASRPYDVPSSVLNIERAALWLAWRPTVPFFEGIALTISDVASRSLAAATDEHRALPTRSVHGTWINPTRE